MEPTICELAGGTNSASAIGVELIDGDLTETVDVCDACLAKIVEQL